MVELLRGLVLCFVFAADFWGNLPAVRCWHREAGVCLGWPRSFDPNKVG